MIEHSTSEICDTAALTANPVVSVYMLAYRHEKFIAEAIEGVLAQTCDFPFELIIGEDCSPDRTLAIALDYQRRFPQIIRVLTSPSNVGAFANAERSRKACRGKYIAICEGDDYWHDPRKLQMQVDAMSADESITLCHTDYDRKIGLRIKRARHRAEKPRYLANGRAYESLLHAWTVKTATAMYRSDTLQAFDRSPFNNPKWPFGDYNKALFAAANGSVAYLPVSTATWRKVRGSATNRSLEQYLAMALAYGDCREQFMLRYPVPAPIAFSVRVETRRRIMKRAFLAGRADLHEDCCRWLIEHQRGDPAMGLRRLALHYKPLAWLVGRGRYLTRWLGMLG